MSTVPNETAPSTRITDAGAARAAAAAPVSVGAGGPTSGGAPSAPDVGTGQAVGGGTSITTMLVLGGVVVLIFGWTFAEFLGQQLRWALREPSDWGHTLAIPLIAGWFVWIRRDDLAATPTKTTWIGLVPLLLGVGWYALCVVGPQALWHHNLRGAGVGLALFGIVLLVFGWKAMRILWFPIAYVIVFGQTVSKQAMDVVTLKLQDIAAVGAHLLLGVIGLDVDRSGNVLTVWSNGIAHPLNVAEACSGMRMLVAFLALGVAMAYAGLPYLWQRVALVALGVPVAVAVNVLRVVTLGLLGVWNVNAVQGDFHTFVGLVWLVPAFLIYLGCLWILRRIVVEQPVRGAATAS
ncbi:MAG: exosortase/archaeosortase family protein [Phycisphaerales bacterium]